jgi:hypothetical protein
MGWAVLRLVRAEFAALDLPRDIQIHDVRPRRSDADPFYCSPNGAVRPLLLEVKVSHEFLPRSDYAPLMAFTLKEFRDQFAVVAKKYGLPDPFEVPRE